MKLQHGFVFVFLMLIFGVLDSASASYNRLTASGKTMYCNPFGVSSTNPNGVDDGATQKCCIDSGAGQSICVTCKKADLGTTACEPGRTSTGSGVTPPLSGNNITQSNPTNPGTVKPGAPKPSGSTSIAH